MKTKFKHIWLFILLLTLGSNMAQENKKNIYIVPIQDTIDLGIPSFVKRAISIAESNNSELIIFDIDTFGGRVDAATQIKDAISATDITTIAFINRRAISAGSLISLSCDKIYMTDDFFYTNKNIVGTVLCALSFFMIYTFMTLI